MIDPKVGIAAMREYLATVSDEQLIDDLRLYSPELAKRWGITEHTKPARRRPGVREWFASLGARVHHLFS